MFQKHYGILRRGGFSRNGYKMHSDVYILKLDGAFTDHKLPLTKIHQGMEKDIDFPT